MSTTRQMPGARSARQPPSANGYGSYTLSASGVWAYTLDNSNAAVEALNVGGTLTDTFTATTVDGTQQLVTITIHGTDDAALIVGLASGSVTEAGGVANATPGIPIATGDLNSTDVDNPSDAWSAVGTATASANGYGSYTLSASGVWTYTLDNTNAAVQALNVGGTLTDTFTATTVDGTQQLVTITIHGTDDAAVISGVTSGSVTEAGGVANATPGIPVAVGNLDATDVDNAPDAWSAVGTATASANGYGTYTLSASGVWTYTLDNSNAAVEALNVGGTLTDTFTATTVDGTQQLVTITIHGTDDAAVISGVTSGSVTDAGGVANATPGTPVAVGNLDATDVDNAPDAWSAVGTATASANGYGSYTLSASGVWTYTLDNSNAAVEALNVGQTLTDTFTATTVDGTQQLVTITIHGTDDAAVISGVTSGSVTEAGGVANATPGTPVAVGNLDAADVDNPPDAWSAVGTATASANGYGSYTLSASGVWTYTLDNSNAAVEALNVGGTLTDTFTATTVDGTQQLVTITIHGTDDAAVISGTATGAVTEAGGVANATPGIPVAVGNLDATDVDNPPDAWSAVGTATASANGYGTYTLSASGVWTYTLDNSNAAVEALNVGGTLTDTFTAATVDGTQQLVTITIHGTDDAALIVGLASGSVTEAGGVANATPGIPVATGDLNSTDVDNPPDAWSAVGTATASANGYGTYTLSASGVWTYTLDNSNAAVEALNVGQTLTDTFTVSTVDGTQQQVTITIHGANDTAVISGVTSGSVIEAGGVGSGIPGIPFAVGNLDATDVDNPPDAWTAVGTATASANGYGSYTLTAAGVWIYRLDNSNAAVEALNVGQTLTDTFTVSTVDGTQQLVTITIHGTDDAAVISGDFIGTVLEAGGVANATPGIPIATGDLDAADIDSPPDWTPVGTATASANGYGTYTLTAAGVWTYTLDNSNAAVEALNVGGTLTDTFTAATVDGTQQLVTITIHGANDTAVISGTVSGSVTEAGGVANATPGIPIATGDLNSTDVDNPNDAWDTVSTLLRGASGYGSYTLSASGAWTYTLDNSNAAVEALNVGQTLTDTFTATTVDGTQQLVTITINGTDDAAVISGTVSGSVTEAGGAANATPGIPIATGDLNSTDVDNPPDAWSAVGTATASANGYGTYTLSASGVWTYTLDNSNAAVEALNVGGTLTDTFTAATVDGTQQQVTITIHGANDAAVIGGDTTGSVVGAGGVANGTPGTSFVVGDLNSIDVDNTSDSWTAIETPTLSANGYGTFTIDSAGLWVYILDNNNAAVQALNAGDTLTDTFTVATIDGTTQAVTITINGTNDAAVITGPVTGTVVEASGVANGAPGIPIANGDLNATDVDSPNDAWVADGTATASVNGFGAYTLTVAGLWTYTLDNSNAAVQALNVGDSLTDRFIVTTIDGTAQVVTITIDGANDAAVITGDTTGSVLEAGGVANGAPGIPIATGHLNSIDVDNLDDAWDAVGTSLRGDSSLGTYTLTAAGVWTYTLDNSNPTVQALNAGQTLTDTFTATTVDGTQQLVTININGANDAAAISGAASGSVTEAGGVANGTPGTPTATGDLNSTDVDNLSDAWTAIGSPIAGANGFGSYTLTSSGVWTYTLDNSNAAVQALNVGDTLTDSFTATTVDGTAQVVTITINGANDAAVISGPASGTVTEAGGVANGTPGNPIASGDLNSTDVDNSDDTWDAVGTPLPTDNDFGTYTLTAAGLWVYTLNDSNAAVQALNVGQALTDSFTVTTIDGTSQVVTITITGANDAAVISGVVNGSVTEAGGVANGTPGTPTATGDLNSTDVDNTNDAWTAVSSPAVSASGFGSYTLTASGVWAYTLNNNNAAVQALNVGDTLTDTFTVSTVDGTTQLVTITINGANDAAVISGVTSGAVVEAGGLANGTPGTPVATGNLNSLDGDNTSDAWTAVGTATASSNGYGTYTLSAAGLWVYTLDNNNAAVQALNVGQTLTDTFTVTTIDGTAQLVTITINGVNDTAVITGPATGTVTEAGGVNNDAPGTPTVTGNLNSTDVDNSNDAWTAVNSPAASANGFGSYTLTADGVWAYTLNNSNPAVQALNVGDTLIDTFTATTVDGTTQAVTVTINGTNDAAVITGATTGSVIEEGGVGSGIPGIPVAIGHLDASEVDNPPDDWTPVAIPTPSVNSYGTYTLTAAGVWTYTLDNSNPAVQALNVGQTLTDTFTATTVDGTPQVVTITIHGTDDAAVVSGDFAGTVLEAGGVNNETPGIPTATGDLDAADVDNPPDWTPVGTLTPGDNGFGSYTLTAAGVWTYTLDNNNAAVQALNPDSILTDTFTARTVDGTPQLITITIHGANDTAVITGPVTGTVTEAGGVNNGTPGTPTATGDLNSTDVDNPNDAWEPDGTFLRGDSGFSTYTVTASGVWTYTLDNNNPAVQALNVGQTLTDTLTAITVDGTEQQVTITINGANDAAVISGVASGSVTEAGGVNNATPGTPTTTGDLDSTDVDNPNDAWAAVSSPTISGFGSYNLTATGVWTYTLNNSNATVQALSAGQTLTDTFTAVTVDGTQQLVTITINGSNDAAVITGPASGSVTEAGGVNNGTPGTPTATGNLNSTDVDNPNDLWQPVGTLLRSDSGFSTYTLTAAGVWTYTLDDSNPAVQALNVGQTLTDTFTAFTVDGTAQVVTITINGANDAAVITGKTTGSVIEAGGLANGTPGTPTTTGDLNSTDVDNPSDSWTAVSSPTTSGFGSYNLTPSGVWTYTLNNSNATVQALNVGQTLTDTFTATTVDGTSQLVTITINGADDAAVISGAASGSVIEASGVANGTPGNPTATGDLNSTDVDNPSDAWTTVGTPLPTNNGYGSYTLTAAGVWTYTLNNSNAAVQALNVGQTLTDTFSATTVDGTTQLVTVTINGANDAAVISGVASGSVIEAGEINNGAPGTPTATGDLNAADVDNPSDAWAAISSSVATASGFGSYTLTAAGVWTYTLNNSNATVQALNVGQTLTDTFTAFTVDGTAQVVTITINGSNDTPVAAADNNAGDPVTESGVNPGNSPFAGDPSAAGNVLTNDLDVDSGDTKTVVAVNGEAPNVGKPLIGTYGMLALQANGSWSYALDNADPDTNALAQGQTATDVFTYTMADASGATSSAVLTIAITGTNDAPDIIIRSGDSATANLTETGAGLTTNGTMTVRDPDLTDAVSASVSSVALSGTTGGLTVADVLGMLSLTPGSIAADPGDTNNLGWAFDSGAQVFNFLNSDETLTLAYTVQATDGNASDAQTVAVTINGTGGAPAANDDHILVSNSTTAIIPWSCTPRQ